jgi:hypothetical protein
MASAMAMRPEVPAIAAQPAVVAGAGAPGEEAADEIEFNFLL